MFNRYINRETTMHARTGCAYETTEGEVGSVGSKRSIVPCLNECDEAANLE